MVASRGLGTSLAGLVLAALTATAFGAAAGPATAAGAVAGSSTASAAAPTAGVFHTTVAGLRIRGGPSTADPIVRTLGAAGTPVTLTCWTSGQAVGGDAVWYRTSAPAAGYVAGFYVNTGRDPNPSIPACTTARVFHTTVAGLRIRGTPTTASPIVRTLGAAGTPVTLTCWVRGQAVVGDAVWYRTSAPAAGYVAGFYVNTGRDPNPAVPACG